LDRLVAIKILAPHLTWDQRQIKGAILVMAETETWKGVR